MAASDTARILPKILAVSQEFTAKISSFSAVFHKKSLPIEELDQNYTEIWADSMF